MNDTEVINWLKATDKSLSSISSKTKISTKTLLSAKRGSKVRKSTIKRIYLSYSEEIIWHNKKIALKGANMNIDDLINENKTDKQGEIDASYIIELQKEQLEAKEQQIAELKSVLEQNPFQTMTFDQIEADFITHVYIRYTVRGMERKIEYVQGKEIFVKHLELTEKEIDSYFDWGVWHKTLEHPCNELIDKECLKEIQEASRIFPSLLNSMKFIVGKFHHTIPVVYNYRGKKLITNCSNKIFWSSKPIKIIAKTKIIES